jgi:hypothetical protein
MNRAFGDHIAAEPSNVDMLAGAIPDLVRGVNGIVEVTALRGRRLSRCSGDLTRAHELDALGGVSVDDHNADAASDAPVAVRPAPEPALELFVGSLAALKLLPRHERLLSARLYREDMQRLFAQIMRAL